MHETGQCKHVTGGGGGAQRDGNNICDSSSLAAAAAVVFVARAMCLLSRKVGQYDVHLVSFIRDSYYE